MKFFIAFNRLDDFVYRTNELKPPYEIHGLEFKILCF